MSHVNLLPPEFRQQQATQRTTSLIIAGALAALVLLGLFYLLQVQRLSSAQSDLAEQQATNNQLQAEIAQLQPYADLESELEQKQQLLDTVYQNEVSWSAALLDVSRVIPDASYLTSLAGQIQTAATAAAPGAAPTEPTGLVGDMTFSGFARETSTIANWLTRLAGVDGWANPWVTSATETTPRSLLYNFSSGLDLTDAAVTERGQGGGQV